MGGWVVERFEGEGNGWEGRNGEDVGGNIV